MLMYFIGYIAYICNRGVDASQANLLKNALIPPGRVSRLGEIKKPRSAQAESQ